MSVKDLGLFDPTVTEAEKFVCFVKPEADCEEAVLDIVQI